MKLKLGISPCPNDTFAFYGLINQKIDLGDYEFEIHFEDVEALNRKAELQILDITKLSFHAFAFLSEKYQILNAGSALGNACGPLLISKREINEKDIAEKLIAIPGKKTTANLLLSIAFPDARHKKEVIFSEIEDDVLSEKADLGLIIHENRFTYQQKGLKKIMDLGVFWEKQTGLPIPLGCIAINRNISYQHKLEIDHLIRESIKYSRDNPEDALSFAQQYAQEMDRKVMMQHINLYVNDYTEHLGDIGRKAIRELYKFMVHTLDYAPLQHPIFIDD